MAIITNTVTRYDYTKSVREDLSDIIYNISPVDVPFQSNIGRDKASQTFTEWQTDTLAAAVTTNAQLEGDDIVSTADTRAATNRVGNYTEISRKIVAVTGTLEAAKAGMRSANLQPCQGQQAEARPRPIDLLAGRRRQQHRRPRKCRPRRLDHH